MDEAAKVIERLQPQASDAIGQANGGTVLVEHERGELGWQGWRARLVWTWLATAQLL